MITLAIDWGEKRTGLAFSTGKVAAPLPAISAKPQERVLEEISNICQELQAQQIVLGLPLNSSGELTPTAEKIFKFGNRLKNKINIPVSYWNEALTSKEAFSKRIGAGRKRKSLKNLDSAAAAIILQNYLEAQTKEEECLP